MAQNIEMNAPQITCPEHNRQIELIDVGQILDGQVFKRALCRGCKRVFENCIDYETAYETHHNNVVKCNEKIEFNFSNFIAFQKKILLQIRGKLENMIQKIVENDNKFDAIEKLQMEQIDFNITNYEEGNNFANEYYQIYHSQIEEPEIYYQKKVNKILDDKFAKISDNINQIIKDTHDEIKALEKLIILSEDVVSSQTIRKQIKTSTIGKFKNQNYNAESKMYFDQNEENFVISQFSALSFFSKIQQQKQKKFTPLSYSQLENFNQDKIENFCLNQEFTHLVFSNNKTVNFIQLIKNQDQISIYDKQTEILPQAVEYLELDSVHNYCFIFFSYEFQVWKKLANNWSFTQKICLQKFFKAQFNLDYSLLMIQQEKRSNVFDIYEINSVNSENITQIIDTEKILKVHENLISQPYAQEDYQIFFFSPQNKIQQNKTQVNLIFFMEEKLYFQTIDEEKKTTQTYLMQKLIVAGKLVYSSGSKILILISFDKTMLYIYKLDTKQCSTRFVSYTHVQIPKQIVHVKISPKDKFIALVDKANKVIIYQVQLLPIYDNIQRGYH